MKLYLFNPAHDLALAHGKSHYIPPKIIKKFAYDFALLTFWYAKTKSSLLLFDESQKSFLEKYNYLFNCAFRSFSLSELNKEKNSGFHINDAIDIYPWGWNHTLREWLIEEGIDESNLPTKEYIFILTRLSHRSSSVQLLPKLQLSSFFCGESSLFYSITDVIKFVESRPCSVLKEPISGSGRGVMWCDGELITSLQTWAERIIERQHGLVAEPCFNKVIDFAMEFEFDDFGDCQFLGYSLFYTSNLGSYQGNHLLSDQCIEDILGQYVPKEELLSLKKELAHQLKDLTKGNYKGYLGVDMMICRFMEAPHFRIHPCVEINFRMNMGIVAWSIHKHFLHPMAKGKFETYFYKKDEEALVKHLAMEAKYPLIIENHRLISGYLPLVPVTSTSRYRAWVIVE